MSGTLSSDFPPPPGERKGYLTPFFRLKLETLTKSYLCGSSPANNVRNWFVEGATKGLVFGAVSGGVTGTVFGTPVGGVFGAILGGLTEMTITGTAGLYGGLAATGACSALGMYGQ